MNQATFDTPAKADLQGTRALAEIARREGFSSSTDWAAQFAQALCKGDSLDVMRERFAALAGVAGHIDPDNAAAEEIGRHYLILEALFKKLLIQSVAVADSHERGRSEAAERLMNGAFKAQRAAMACLSAMKVLRDTAPAPTRPEASKVEEGSPAPSTSATPLALLSGSNELIFNALD